MNPAERLKRDRLKLVDSFREAVRQTDKTTAAGWVLLTALLGTTLPLASFSAFFCHFAIICTIYIIANKSAHISKQLVAVAIALGLMSVTIGCSPLLSEPNTEIIEFCEKETSNQCLYGMSQGYAVFGWDIRFATIEQAKLAGGFSNVFGTEHIKGNGLVSVTRIVVYGS